MTIESGIIKNGEFSGQPWEITRIGEEHYILYIGGEFWASADCIAELSLEIKRIENE